MQRPSASIGFALLLSALSCGNPQRDRLERGVAYARRQFVEAGRNPLAAVALGSTVEMGGGLTNYIANGMPDNADLPRFQDYRPAEPWSIALRSTGGDTVIIEGFGASLDRPLLAETVLVRPPRRP